MHVFKNTCSQCAGAAGCSRLVFSCLCVCVERRRLQSVYVCRQEKRVCMWM